MPAGDYGTSSIEWRRTAPKTYTLTNTEQVGGPTGQTQTDLDAERLLMQRMMEAQADTTTADQWAERADTLPGHRESTPQERRMWRRQLRDYFSELNDPRSDHALGFQGLIDSGAVTYDEDGIYTNVNVGSRHREAMVRAGDEWADKVGLWRPREGGGEDFDPSNYRPYETQQGQRKTWEEMIKDRTGFTISEQEINDMMGRMGGK